MTDVDDVKDMGESKESVEQSLESLSRDFLTKAATHGLSRRNMIKASVVAGGLVWSAPVLLTGKAAAQEPPVPCCENGTPFTVKVAEQQGVNCGTGCLTERDQVNTVFDCPDQELVDCLGELELVVGDFTGAGEDAATIILKAGVTLISASVKTQNRCYFADCPCFPSTPSDPTCPNTCTSEAPNACVQAGPGNRIWVTAGPNGSTVIHVDTSPSPLNTIEISICLAPEITGMC
jgi:hypothetical protein